MNFTLGIVFQSFYHILKVDYVSHSNTHGLGWKLLANQIA